MNTISNRFVASPRSKIALAAVLLSLGFATPALAYTQITSQLDFGARGANVTNLQAFFADNAAIYPEGLVTGYFGGLTQASVKRFQAAYGFDQVGRVGPMTQAKINSLMINGGWVTAPMLDVSGPAFYNTTQSQTNTTATFAFNTNENTMARVVYNTSPVMFNEGDINSNGFGAIGGSATNSANGMNTSHTIMLSGLQPNTLYYTTVIATDASGNVSIWGPNATFRTNVQ